MITLAQLTELLGWASVLNIAMLLLTTVLLVVARPFLTSVHSRLFGLSADELAKCYFNYLAQYKVLTFVFNIAPYSALKIMGH